jgi:hypothetical protein
MKLSELRRIVNLYENNPYDSDVCLIVKVQHTTIGAHPMVSIKNVSMGFDWEQGKFLLWPEQDVTYFDVDAREQYRALERKYGLLYNENGSLKRELAKKK